jgi:hypothetical protein
LAMSSKPRATKLNALGFELKAIGNEAQSHWL